VQRELIDQGDDFVWCAGTYLLFAGAPGSKGDLLLIPIAIKCGAQDPNWQYELRERTFKRLKTGNTLN
jgi:hypothetical protein